MWAVAAAVAAGALVNTPFRNDDNDDNEDDNDNDFAAFFVNCSFTALFFVFLNVRFALCAFFNFSFFFFLVLAMRAVAVVAVVVAVCTVAAAAAVLAAVAVVVYYPFRNLVL